MIFVYPLTDDVRETHSFFPGIVPPREFRLQDKPNLCLRFFYVNLWIFENVVGVREHFKSVQPHSLQSVTYKIATKLSGCWNASWGIASCFVYCTKARGEEGKSKFVGPKNTELPSGNSTEQIPYWEAEFVSRFCETDRVCKSPHAVILISFILFTKFSH